ncbi:hypothetical protein PENTCL1PPCAC_25308 [Pristionchus entomophagus]|uniref:C2H2-type domain-containing protein n=1 Tax=Pristionchus entomophagus TaxID=358040 RepID=A0AAV5U9R5_9BILA|nr:hypothetical protein PENTCL1PPCAC_25308 [Pristionchus entomophagus]
MTLRVCPNCGAADSLDERGLCSCIGSMEVQQQMAPHSLLIHSPYDMATIKQEPGTGSPDQQGSPFQTTSDMLFPFGLPTSAFMPHHHHNNNSEGIMNHNSSSSRAASSASACTKDRKRPYPCNICPSRFGSKMELEEHQNSHTGQKPFECDVCKARFNRRSTLWNHKRIHSDAKPFVCSVCQMTFKWKNSLKCHKEMHLRKNESSTVLDNDLRQLTYATAAKRTKTVLFPRCLITMTSQEASVLPGSTPSPVAQPITNKKKNGKSSSSSTSSSSSSGIGAASLLGGGGLPMQDGSPSSNLLGLPTAHIDIDQASLDTLVHQNNGNILVQLCSEVDPHLGRTNLLGMDDSSLLSSFGELKNEIYTPSADSLGMGSHQPTHHINVNVQIPIVGNMLNFRGFGQSLPSVHHLTSTASSLPSVSVPMDYTGDLSQSQYIVSHNDMMPSVSYQQSVDPCLVLTSGADYMNYDLSVFNQPIHHGYETNASTPGDSHSSVPSDGMDGGVSGVFGDTSGKSIPHDRW